jgi:hypothetical protein
VQRKIVIEIITDYRDKGKNDAVETLARRHAAQLYAGVTLINDGVKADVVAFSEDFFSGRQDFDLLMQEQIAQPAPIATQDDALISDEMMNALGKS